MKHTFSSSSRTRSLILALSKMMQEKLRSKVLATEVTDPTMETLGKLPYLTNLICELRRIYPQLVNLVALEHAVLEEARYRFPEGHASATTLRKFKVDEPSGAHSEIFHPREVERQARRHLGQKLPGEG